MTDKPTQAPDAAAAGAAATTDEAQGERWLVLLLAAAVFMSVLNTTMVNVALPTIRDQFGVSEAGAGWLATLYSLFFGIVTPFYGRLGDRYGLRRLYIIGMLIFAISSLLATIVPTGLFALLVIFRVGQGLGSAAVPSLGTAMITRAVPSQRRGAAIGMIAASVGAGQALGPTLGGALTEFLSWRAVFLISALVLALIPFQYRTFPSAQNREAKPVDWLGGSALAIMIAGALIAVGNIQSQGIFSPVVISCFALAVVGFAITAIRQARVTFPFIDPQLLSNRRFVLCSMSAFMMMSAAISTLIIAPFLLEDVNGLPTSRVGLVLLSQAGMVTILSRPIGRLADRFDGLLLSTAGLALVFAVIVTFATAAVGWPVWALIPLFLVFGIGQASTFSPLQTTVTRTVPRHLAGTGIGLYNMLFFVGSAFGAAVATALLSARKNNDSLLPFYTGPAEFSYFGDAFLYGVAVSLVGLVLLQIARKTPQEDFGNEA